MSRDRHCTACGSLINALNHRVCPACALRSVLELTENPDEPAVPLRELGDYELIEEIARGGMGAVFKARQSSLNRLVALKVITGAAFATPAMVRRFQVEAELAASLDHPNIVPIYEVGEDDAQPYFSMRLIEGGPLRADGDLRAQAALMVKVARAISYAHQRGILHRDLKPGNILVDAGNEPFLTDFGLAKLTQGESTLTHTNAVLGTPSYMSPEQAAGGSRAVTTAVDVYGLGAVLYFAITGAPPFAGGTSLETVRQVLDKDPRQPSILNPAIDRDLETICLKCLEKEPERRYRSADEVADELERWLRHEPIIARPVSAAERFAKILRRHPVVSLVAALAALFAISGAAGIFWQWRRAGVERNEAVAARKEAVREASYSQLALAQRYLREGDAGRARNLLLSMSAAHWNWEWGHLLAESRQEIATLEFPVASRATLLWSADGRTLSAFNGAVSRAWNTADWSEASHPGTTAPEDLSSLALSSDISSTFGLQWGQITRINRPPGSSPLLSLAAGRILLRRSSGEVVVVDRATGAVISQLEAPPPTRLAFTSDGSKIVSFPGGTPQGTALEIWDAVTGRLLQTIPPSPETALRTTIDATAEFFAVLRGDGTVEFGKCDRPGDTQSANIRITNPTGLGITARGQRLITHHPDGSLRLWDTTTLSEAAYIPFRVHRTYSNADGSRLAVWGGEGMIRLLDPLTGEEESRLYPGGAGDSDPEVQFSHDGRLIATFTPAGEVKIWLAHDRRGRFEHDEGFKKTSLSQDGLLLAGAHRSGKISVWDLGSGRQRWSLEGHRQWVLGLDFAPGGNQLVSAAADNTARIWDAALGTEIRVLPHDAPVMCAVFSSDNRRILTGTALGTVRFWDAATGIELDRIQASSERVVSAARSPRGGFAVIFQNGNSAIWNVDGERMDLTPGTRLGFAIAFSRDGKQMLTGGGDQRIRIWDVETGALLRELATRSAVFDLKFSPDGSRLLATVTGNITGVQVPTLALYDTAEWRETLAFPFPPGQITAAHFTPDARGIVGGYEAGQLGTATTAYGFQLESLPFQAAAFDPAIDLDHAIQKAALAMRRERAVSKPATPFTIMEGSAPRWPERGGEVPPACIDLGANYNALLDVAWRPLGGWLEHLDHLGSLRPGLHTFGGVPFDARGLIVVPSAGRFWENLNLYRSNSAAIRLDRSARKLHFLHAATYTLPEGMQCGGYTLAYEDGSVLEIPLRYGVEIRSWNLSGDEPAEPGAASVAYEFEHSLLELKGRKRRLYHWTWENPKPGVPLQTIKLAAGALNAPFLVALTVE